MSRPLELYSWTQELARRFPGLPPTFVTLLALWSFGLLLARQSGLTTVATFLAATLQQSPNTVRQRLREFYQESAAKAGTKRGCQRWGFEVTACFAPLLQWLLSLWSCSRLALALDVTNLGNRFHVLCISVLYGGIGIPVAWKILPANQKDAWHPHWCDLLQRLQPAVPTDWTVVVLSDRGLESARLFQQIVAVGWHPLMRVKAGGKFRPHGWVRWYTFGSLVRRPGQRWAATGLAYKNVDEPLCCTLLGCWDQGHAEAWLLLTDLAVGAANPCWYAYRAWIEQGFKVIKSGALHWQHTRMTAPERAERLWLALAVTILWLVVIGATVEGERCRETLQELCSSSQTQKRRGRVQRLLLLGWATWLVAMLQGQRLAEAKLAPEPWPEVWPAEPPLTEQEFLQRNQGVLPL